MTDMGIFRTTIAIENPSRRGTFREIPDVMVDTGSEYTWVPRPILESLKLVPERTARFQTANGRAPQPALGSRGEPEPLTPRCRPEAGARDPPQRPKPLGYPHARGRENR